MVRARPRQAWEASRPVSTLVRDVLVVTTPNTVLVPGMMLFNLSLDISSLVFRKPRVLGSRSPSKLGEKSLSPRKGTGYHPTFVEFGGLSLPRLLYSIVFVTV